VRTRLTALRHGSGGVGAVSPLLPWFASNARSRLSISLTRSASDMTTATPTLTCVWLGLSANRLLYFPASHCPDCILSLARLIASRVGSSASEMSTSSSAQTSAPCSRARARSLRKRSHPRPARQHVSNYGAESCILTTGWQPVAYLSWRIGLCIQLQCFESPARSCIWITLPD
jgi:hypothetical protein